MLSWTHSENEFFCAGDFEREQQRGAPGVPGVLPTGECTLAQLDSSAAPGSVRCCERTEEKRHGAQHDTVRPRETCMLCTGFQVMVMCWWEKTSLKPR